VCVCMCMYVCMWSVCVYVCVCVCVCVCVRVCATNLTLGYPDFAALVLRLRKACSQSPVYTRVNFKTLRVPTTTCKQPNKQIKKATSDVFSNMLITLDIKPGAWRCEWFRASAAFERLEAHCFAAA
jgi:hypothetical protein